MKKTSKFFASLGVVAGYGHDNAVITADNAVEIAAKAWQQSAAAVMKKYGTYVGAVITSARTVYHKDWGCPVGGEITVAITGECNPEYTELAAYKAATLKVLKRTAKKLGQSTTQLTFLEVEFEYLDFRPKAK
ncbi:MAG: hypothetical protein WC467_03725 [Patescibacteria group bacterium]